MPPSSDPPSSYQHPAVDPALYLQEEVTRKRSPGRKGQGKKSRRHESGRENPEERAPSAVVAQPMTIPSSILSQLHSSTAPIVPPNGVSSSLLEAWDHTPIKHDTDPSPSPPSDRARDTQYGRSPPHNPSSRASLAGSPPQYQPPLEELRGGFSHASPPTSPRSAHRQPIRQVSDYQNLGGYLGSSPSNKRPVSMHTQNHHYPPPPHRPQAHFYGAPQIDFAMSKPISEDLKSTEGCCCVLDSLPSLSKETAENPQDVLLVGFDQGLDIFRFDRKRFDHIGRIDGLRGPVIGAKVLSCQARAGLQADDPLVAIIIHGPCVPSERPPETKPVEGEDQDFEASRSMLQAMHVADTSHYQTSVEIYSLKNGKHVTSLFQSPRVEMRSTYDGQPSVPPPLGDLTVHASGKFVVVSCGSSGEVYIFESFPEAAKDAQLHFQCIGKIWTRTSSTNLRTASASSSDSEAGMPHDDHVRRVNAAVLSLSNRWLAVVPPPSSSHTTLHGLVDTQSPGQKVPGLSSHTPPAEPQVTCDLDMLQDESVLNRVARDVAQGALKSAQWVAAEGMQAWNNYWSKPPDHHRPPGPAPYHGFTGPLPPSPNFPPTHAQGDVKDRVQGQPTLVSIIDLAKLSQSQQLKPSLALQPIATFSLPLGCSVLSFSPSGLNLLTASAKGDVQHVWDLMRMVHGESGRMGAPDVAPTGPSVRQVARFSRMTEAKIVDVVWTEPRGERFAITTKRGTVHINELPPSAFQWPPYRRRPQRVISPSDEAKSEDDSDAMTRPRSVGSTIGSAFGMFAGKTQTALASVRGRSPSTNSGFPSFGNLAMTAGTGAKGGKVIAAGINRSVSAAAAGTVSTIRHYGENRLALPASPNPVSPGCARWLGGKSQGSIAVIGGGTVRVHSIRQSTDTKAGQRRPSVVADKPVEFSLPEARRSIQRWASDDTQPRVEDSKSNGSFWLPQPSRPTSRRSYPDTHPLSYAEIETNAPYQPFHTDPRVSLYLYDEEESAAIPHRSHNSATPWVFGEDIPATKINVGCANHRDTTTAAPGKMENKIRVEENAEDGQRVVVSTTTRRKKTKAETGADEGEFFEEDCEVLDFAENRV